MPTSPLPLKHISAKTWLAFFVLLSTGWLLVASFSLFSPAGLLLGLTSKRLVLAVVAALALLAHLALAWTGWCSPAWRQRLLDRLTASPRPYQIFFLLLSALALSLWAVLFIYIGLPSEHRIKVLFLPYYTRFAPFLAWTALEAVLLLFAMRWLRTVPQAPTASRRALWSTTAAAFALSALAGILAVWTGIGVTPDITGWGGPATPLLVHQVLLAMLLAALASGLILLFKLDNSTLRHTIWIDVAICALLWLAAVFLWMRQPIPRSFFALPGAPPNSEFYPYSDAAYYAYISQSVQLGYGFVNGKVVPRPLYILALAAFHAIAGQKYADIIFLQSLVLALLPVPLYLLGKALHSRALGIMVAALAILRELNAFAATAALEVSHSKLLLADLPTAVMVILLAYLVVRWFQEPSARQTDPLLVGGFLGLTALLRTQAFFFLPAILLGMVWVYFKQWKTFTRATLLLILGTILAISPWLYRNWKSTGQLIFDDPITQTSFVAERYRVEMEPFYPRLAGESEAAYVERLTGQIGKFTLEHPLVFARFVVAHFLNNEITSLAILPLCHGFAPLGDVLDQCTAFWSPLKGNSSAGILVLLLDLALVCLGIALSWQRWKMAGLVPLLFHLAYNGSNALARNSARRYILPVDWVVYFYFSIGVVELLIWAAGFFGLRRAAKLVSLSASSETDHSRPGPEETAIASPGHIQHPRPIRVFRARPRPMIIKSIWIGALFLAAGLTLPVAEVIVPPRYPSLSQAQIVQALLASPALQRLPIDSLAIEQFTHQDAAIAIQGRALYPRYYQPTRGEPSKRWPAYRPYERRPTGKVGWLTVGPAGMNQVGLAIDNRPTYFPNAADVIVVGCQETDSSGYTYIDALLVAFPGAPDKTILRSKLDPLSCPLQ